MTISAACPDPFDSEPITQWLRGCFNGDELAQLKLWEAVSKIIIQYCRQRPGPQTIDGADGIANEAFFQLLKGMQEKRFQRLVDRYDLLVILFHLCKCRTIDSQRRGDSKKRGEGKQTDLDLNNLPNNDAIKSVIEESFKEMLELVIQKYEQGPEVKIFEYAYLGGYSDEEISQLLIEDKRTNKLSARQISTRRKGIIAWLRDKASRME